MALVLVIDDSIDNASLVRAILMNAGHEVVLALNGVEGFHQISLLKPDVVVLDLRLPGSDMDGWQLIRAVRDEPSLHDLPIIVTSVEVMPEDRERAFNAGCNAFLSKPYNIRELAQCIVQYTG
jgi:CheY-like chemotaxis protein